MSCFCTLKAGNLAGSLLPLFPLKIELPKIPSFLEQLAMTPGGASPVTPMSASVRLQMGELLALRLPALAIDPLALGQLQAIVPTLLHIKATLGIDVRAPGAMARLGPMMAQADLAMPALLPLAAVDAAPLLKLSGLLSMLSLLNASGINLLKPGLNLHASLNIAPPFPVAALAPLAPYGVLATLASGFGVGMAELPRLGLMLGALPKLPTLKADPILIARISGLLMAASTCTRLLGFSPFAPGALPRISLMLAPLAHLPAVTLPLAFGEAAQAASLLRMALPLLKINLPTFKLALPALPIPNLAGPALAGSIMADAGLGSLSPCSPLCGMIGSFAPQGLAGKLSSLFG